jgi:hypothetical protein
MNDDDRVDDEEDLPKWARSLEGGPITVDESTTDEALIEAFMPRLAALLRLYGCEPDPKGWRRLAIRLALDHSIDGKPVMQVVTPVDRPEGAGGAEPGVNWGLAMRLRQKTKELGSTKAAAVELARETGQNVRTLQNLSADTKAKRLKLPRWLQRFPWNRKIENALDGAAARLERQSRK